MSRDVPVYRHTTERDEVERDLDLMLSRFWRRAAKVALVVASAIAILSMLVAVLVLAWRWFLHGLRAARDSVFKQFSGVYGWLDEYSPSETEEERLKKYTTLRSRIMHLWDSSLSLGAAYAVPGDIWDWFLLVTVMVFVGFGVWVVGKKLGGVGRRSIMRMRGIQFEAMRPGSSFTRAEIPPCQVQILIPGLLADTHQGYGVRLGDYLVVPQHVLSHFSELIFVGKSRARLLLPVNYTRSRLCDDLAYVYMGPASFAQLGATVARGMDKGFVSNYATVVGTSGASTGRVSKSTLRGRLIYEGSTTAGMSGAAYLVQGCLAGIHQGASGSHNLGISSEVFKAEMAYLTQKESANGSSPSSGGKEELSDKYTPRFTSTWKQEDLAAMAEDRYGDDSGWADEVEEADFWSKKLDFESASKRKPEVVQQISITKKDGSVVQVPLDLQCEGGGKAVVDAVPAHLVDYMQRLVNLRVVERLADLEVKVLQLQQGSPKRPVEDSSSLAALPSEPSCSSGPPPRVEPTTRFPCDFCSQVCRTHERLERHVKSSHDKNLHLESAIAEDTGDSGKTVKQTGSFLGKKASRKKNGTLSTPTSPVKAGKRGFASSADVQSQILASQRNIEKSLKDLVGVLAGRNLGTTQN
uniref:C2H2-type domain-containing protein n=1 Tax=Riboviria sp. TaxID=2585031 RepID=A0A8K1U2K8_9VIRU|nr:MAG: hypothetical protein 2 [Riboviria sp.]